MKKLILVTLVASSLATAQSSNTYSRMTGTSAPEVEQLTPTLPFAVPVKPAYLVPQERVQVEQLTPVLPQVSTVKPTITEVVVAQAGSFEELAKTEAYFSSGCVDSKVSKLFFKNDVLTQVDSTFEDAQCTKETFADVITIGTIASVSYSSDVDGWHVTFAKDSNLYKTKAHEWFSGGRVKHRWVKYYANKIIREQALDSYTFDGVSVNRTNATTNETVSMYKLDKADF